MSAHARTGILGLDDILAGGLTRGCLFLLEGHPGTGKTTVALQFLVAGLEDGHRSLYITLSETKEELVSSAASHGWKLGEGIEVFELPENLLDPNDQQTLLYSSDVELGETVKLILQAVERTNPALVVLDSLSEIRLLAQGSLRYRRQLLALKHYFAKRRATLLMLDDLTNDPLDKTAHSIAHGVIRLEELAPNYGPDRRRLKVMKYRGQSYRSGYHDFAIKTGGIRVFPRLVASEHKTDFPINTLESGVAELDELLGGGIDWARALSFWGRPGAERLL